MVYEVNNNTPLSEVKRSGGMPRQLHFLFFTYIHEAVMNSWENIREERKERMENDRIADHQRKIRGDEFSNKI